MAAGWWASAWNREKNWYLFGVKKKKDVCPARRGGGAGMQARALLACKVSAICSRGTHQNQHQDLTCSLEQVAHLRLAADSSARRHGHPLSR